MQTEGTRTLLCYMMFIHCAANNNCLTSVLLLVDFQLGANAILAVSLAICKAGAAVKKIPLYKVYFCCSSLCSS